MQTDEVNNININAYDRYKTLSKVAFFTAALIILSKISIPLPFTPVPFTLQVIGVLLAGLLLTPFQSASSIGLYLLLGASGFPVFAKGGGVGYILGPTGGFLYGFLIAAPIVSLISKKSKHLLRNLIASLAGLFIIYLLGAFHLLQVTGKGISFVLSAAVLPFIPFDILKALIAASISSLLNARS